MGCCPKRKESVFPGDPNLGWAIAGILFILLVYIFAKAWVRRNYPESPFLITTGDAIFWSVICFKVQKELKPLFATAIIFYA